MKRRLWRCLALGLSVLGISLGTQSFWAQETPKAGKLSKEEMAALQPGLTLRLLVDGKVVDVRRVRLPALHVPAGAAASPFVAPGPVTARWTGYLKAPTKGAYSFRFAGTGSAVLKVQGSTIEWKAGAETAGSADLVRGYNKVELAYTGPPQGDATLRLYWKGESFDFEPIQPDTFFSRNDDADLVASQQLRDGRLNYATLGCTHCHALPGHKKRADCVLPELDHQAPTLAGAGHRLSGAWLARWIADPRALRPTATMPQVLRGDAAAVRQQAADLAAYLGTLTSTAAAPTPATPELAKEGARLFEKTGCIGCHHFKPADQEDTFGRVPLTFAAAKFAPGALAGFLRKPHEHYPWSRMPDFRLDAKDSAALAAFITEQAKGKVEASETATPASAERGAKLFGEAGCAHCHAVKAEPTAAANRPAPAAAAKGCLADKAEMRGAAPHFLLTEPQRTGLLAFLATDGASLTRETPAEFSQRQVQALRCVVCHQRDGVTSKLWDVLAEEGDGSVPEVVPGLSWTGMKLRTAWINKLLAGEHGQRARPWLKLRMPTFPARAELLAAGLAQEHGYPVDFDPRPAVDDKLASIGEKLIQNVGGFNCIGCHGVGKQPPVAPFEAPGINLLDAALRLRHEYYPRWMIDPTRLEPASKMPKFAPDGHTTALKEVLDGDAHRQFEAIWHFIAGLPDKK